jgi:NurA-like 5'-3' nuclease
MVSLTVNMSSTAFKTSKVLEKSTLAKTKVILRRSTRKGAGKRPPTFFEEYSKDIMAVYMEGEDHEEVLKALKEEDSVDYKSNKDEAYEDDSTLEESSSDEGEVES